MARTLDARNGRIDRVRRSRHGFDECKRRDSCWYFCGADQPYGRVVSQSDADREGAISNVVVEVDQRYGLFGLGRMERPARHERIANDRYDYDECDLRLDLHRQRRNRVADSDSYRVGGGAERILECESRERGERWQLDADLVLDQRKHLRGLGRVERIRADQRHP